MAKKFPNFKQLDKMDCGPTCLKIIARYYGRSLELHLLREYCYANRTGVSMLGINDAAERINFRCTGVKSTFEKFATETVLPCIVHWREDHFIVVYKIKVKKNKAGNWEGKIYVSDPAFGLVTYSVEEFLNGWANGKGDDKDKCSFLILAPTLKFFHPDNKDADESKFKLIHFFSYIKPYKKLFAQVMLGMLLGMVFSFIFLFFHKLLLIKVF